MYKFNKNEKDFKEASFSKLPDKVGDYLGPVLSEEIINEVNMWSNLLPTLCLGITKPYSVIFELEKVEREQRKTGKDLTLVIETLKNCCSPSSTVNDSLVFKELREAVVERIIEITGIKSYYERY